MIEPPLQIHTAGVAGDIAALTDGTVAAAKNTSRPYRGHYRGGQETAPTEALEPPLQLTFIIVYINDLSSKTFLLSVLAVAYALACMATKTWSRR